MSRIIRMFTSQSFMCHVHVVYILSSFMVHARMKLFPMEFDLVDD